MTVTFSARVPADLSYREAVGAMLRAVCRDVEGRERCSGLEWRLVSAFNEAFNNVAEHAYAPERTGDVEVIVRADAVRLVLEITDEGRGFDFGAELREAPPPVDALDGGGMGLFIIRRAVSDVRYERGARNRLTLVQELSACRPGTDGGTNNNREGTPC